MKRSSRLVLVVVLSMSAVGLAAAPSGAVAPPKAKVFTVSSAPTSSVWSQAVKLQATITPKGGGTPRGGTVTFLANGTPVGTAVATTRITTLTTRDLPAGDVVVSAQYSGDAAIAPGTTTSGPTVVVGPAPTTVTVTPTRNPVPNAGASELKATVVATTPALTTRRPIGMVTFTADGCPATATVKLNANGVATWRRALCVGEHTVTVTYGGSALHAGSSGSTSLIVEPPEGGHDEEIDEQNPLPRGGFLHVRDSGTGVGAAAFAEVLQPTRTGRLTGVDLAIAWYFPTAPADLRISFNELDANGFPTGALRGQIDVPAASMETAPYDDYTHFELPVPISVTAGEKIGMTVETTGPSLQTWQLAVNNVTHPNTFLRRYDGEWGLFNNPATDIVFRTHLASP